MNHGRCICLAIAALAAPWSLPAASPATPSAYLRLMDGNGDGRISLREYQTWMRHGFDHMDRNGDGIIETAEMPPGGRRRTALTLARYNRQLAATFHRQDTDHDGYLDARELAAPPR